MRVDALPQIKPQPPVLGFTILDRYLFILRRSGLGRATTSYGCREMRFKIERRDYWTGTKEFDFM